MVQESNFDFEKINPILVQSGAALKDSQELEFSIAYVIALINNLITGGITDNEFEELMQTNGKRTLGKLIAELNKNIGLPEEFKEKLTAALRTRNYIIHHFFIDNLEILLEKNGEQKMQKMIVEGREKIIEANALIHKVAVTLMKKTNIDPDEVEAKVRNRFREKLG